MKAFVQHKYKDSDKLVLQALIPFVELNKNALFTQKVLYDDIVSDRNLSEVDGNADYYQRRLDPKRLKEIKKYIYNSILDEKDNIAVSALFPTAMILAVEHEDIPEINDEIVDIEFDKKQRLYIVDGQHRLMAMRQLYEDLNRYIFRDDDEQYIFDYISSYKFNCTILVNYDIWEQGQVFINVNFKQKPVNRSLYYDVYGAEYIESNDPKHLERNKIYLAHELTRFMNEYSGSPFYKNIKMLGTGKGYVSQSFFVEALLPLFKDTGIWYFDPNSKIIQYDILNAYKSELFNFYNIVAESFSKYWGVNENNKVNLICKTTGVGAFTRLMSVLHRQLSKDVIAKTYATPPGMVCNDYVALIKNYMSPLIDKQYDLFGKDSNYGKTGGKGMEDALLKEMIDLLRTAGLLKSESTINYRRTKYEIVKSTISQRYISNLEQYGITGIEGDLLMFMNNHLPSEVDALGTHSRIEEIEDLTVTNVLTPENNKDVSVIGTFICTVEVSFENDDSDTFNSDFPGSFTMHYVNDNGKWSIKEEGSRIFVNTDSYYR
jgi:DGQHR domain-containing protein